jgi:hypothetical protein
MGHIWKGKAELAVEIWVLPPPLLSKVLKHVYSSDMNSVSTPQFLNSRVSGCLVLWRSRMGNQARPILHELKLTIE